MVDEGGKFGVVVHYGNRSLEWRAPVGPDEDSVPHMSNTHSSWELALIRLLLDEFEEWLRRNS